MSILDHIHKIYSQSAQEYLLPPHLRQSTKPERDETLEQEGYEDLSHGPHTPDGLPVHRVIPAKSDFVRGTQAGRVQRVVNANTYQRFSFPVSLTKTNGTIFDSSSSFSGMIPVLAVVDTFTFNPPVRNGALMLYSINRPVTQAFLDGSVFVPQADVILSVLSPAAVTINLTRGHYNIYVGLYCTTANQAVPYSDMANFIAFNSGR